jgi:hypothetical protein
VDRIAVWLRSPGWLGLRFGDLIGLTTHRGPDLVAGDTCPKAVALPLKRNPLSVLSMQGS